MGNEKIINKIKMLLALGNKKSNENDFEAQSALLKAHELMAKHNISVQQTEHIDEQPMVALMCKSTDKRGFRKALAVTIANNFRCKTMVESNGEISMFGFEDDVRTAVSAYNFAYDYAFRQGTKLYNLRYNNGMSTKGVFNSYTIGFIRGLKEKLDAQSQALMVITPTEVKEKFDEMTKGFRTSSSNVQLNRVDNRAYDSGLNDGRNVFATKAIGN